MIRSCIGGILIIVISSCSTEGPAYKSYLNFYKDTSNEFVVALGKIPDPELEITLLLDSSWNFMPGDPTEGFVAEPIAVKGPQVNLPHRILIPDTPLWYERVVKIPTQGILTIRADDGAQFFINKKRVRRLEGIHFPVDTIGNVLITIRVLNNAMSGGLQRVSFSTTEQFQKYNEERSRQISLKTLVKKATLMNVPSVNCMDLVRDALNERTDESIHRAEECMKDFPYFIGPYLIRKNTSTMIVKVESEKKETISLRWGAGSDISNSIKARGPLASFELSNLEPGKSYSYQLRCNKTVSKLFTFKLQDDSEGFSFNVWADSQSGWRTFASQVNLLTKYEDAFGIGVGDLVGNGSDAEEWKEFFSILSVTASQRPYYLIPGNHDYDGNYDDLKPLSYLQYTGYNPSNYFFWTYGDAAFIALDPNENFPIGIPKGSVQYNWLHEQVNTVQWKNSQWRFVFLHQTLYSQGWEGYQGDIVLRDLLEPLMESAKIDFVVSGHTHDYERLTRNYGGQEVTFLVVGGAGGTIEPPESSENPKMDTLIKQHHMGRFYIYNDSIRFEAIDIHGQLLDSFKRSKKL